jgi:tetratricopeptide (TPR) repeat protein
MERLSAQLFAAYFPPVKKTGVWSHVTDRAASVAAGARGLNQGDCPAALPEKSRGPAEALVGALAGLGEHGSLTPFGPPVPPNLGMDQRARFSFVQALSQLGVANSRRMRQGDPEVARQLEIQELNLRQACLMAGDQRWWDSAAGAAEGLGALYQSSGRVHEWEEVVERLRGMCSDATTDRPLAGRERLWRTVTEQSVDLATRFGRLPRAEYLQRLCVEWDRQCAEAAAPASMPDAKAAQPESVRALAGSLFCLGEILRREGTPAVKVEEEAVALRERLGERVLASEWAFELGAAYTETPAIRDLAQAERWLRRSLDLIPEEDPAAKADCLGALGRVAWERFNEARKGNAPESELRRHLGTARQYYQRALEHDRGEDWARLASHNQQLGHVSYSLGDIDRALPYYRESIRCDELQGNIFGAAHTRFNVAIALRDVDRLAEARKYGRLALEEFETLGSSSGLMIERCQKLLAAIEAQLKLKRRQRATGSF